MGRELDSLADVISFGVAPAVIAYGCGMQGLYDRIVLVYFVACGVSRLARYNVTAEALSEGGGKVKYFEGTPIPTSLLLVVLLFVAAWQGALGDAPLVRRGRVRRLHAASAGAGVRGLRLADGQPHTHSQALSARSAAAAAAVSIEEWCMSLSAADIDELGRRSACSKPPAWPPASATTVGAPIEKGHSRCCPGSGASW